MFLLTRKRNADTAALTINMVQKAKRSDRAFSRHCLANVAKSILSAGCIFLFLWALIFNPHQVSASDNDRLFSWQGFSKPARQYPPATSEPNAQPITVPHPKRADFKGEPKSRNAQNVADWAVDSGDNQSCPFAILDKIDAKVFVFDADGRLLGAAPALVGQAKGDTSVPGIGQKKLSEVRPEEKTTPAGRFMASMGINFNGKDVLWVDYEGAVAIHRVVTSNPKERRLERLASPDPAEHRISFGCINVPAKFFDDVIKPTCTGTYCVVYVLPEIKSNREVFPSYYDVDSGSEQAQLHFLNNNKPTLRQ